MATATRIEAGSYRGRRNLVRCRLLRAQAGASASRCAYSSVLMVPLSSRTYASPISAASDLPATPRMQASESVPARCRA